MASVAASADALPPARPTLTRQSSSIDEALSNYSQRARTSLQLLKRSASGVVSPVSSASAGSVPLTKFALPKDLKGCIFVGHTSTDMDSIGSAVGCAELFKGHASRASEVNSETKFALEYWGLEQPAIFSEVRRGLLQGSMAREESKASELGATIKVCLVDHNQSSQMAPGVDPTEIRGCIDHHALQSGTIVTSLPIFVLIQPWGSACTIVASMFLQAEVAMSKKTAGMLLSGILSDTLNLNSPTTTEMDRLMVALLALAAEVSDVNALAKSMFRAKSKDLLSVSSHMLLRGDLKFFSFASSKDNFFIAFGVIETVEMDAVLERSDELLLELRALKREKKVHVAFVAVVDIMQITSQLLLCGSGERGLAHKAFGGDITHEGKRMQMGKRVSRKKDFIPPLSDVLQAGWTPPAPSQEELEEKFGAVRMQCTPHGCIVKRAELSFAGAGMAVVAAKRMVQSLGHSHSHDGEDATGSCLEKRGTT